MRPAGLTLWELLCVLLVVGTALGIGVPTFFGFVLDARRTADVNAFVLAVHVARTEAVKRGRPVILCKTATRERCGSAELRYDAGWMVFENSDDLTPPHRSSAEPVIYAHAPEIDGTIEANRAFFEFRPYSRRSTNGTAVFCDERGPEHARAVIVSYTGRPRVDTVRPDGRPLTCAGLP